MAKTNTIRSNSLQTNSVRLNGVEGLRRVSLQAGEIPDIPPTYTLSASVANGVVSATLNGVVVSLPYTANEGDVIVVEVTPNDGYAFEGWNDGNTDNPRTITMNADVALSAQCVEVVQPPVGNYIQFEDKNVEAICVAIWSSDGIGLTEEDAAKVTTIGTKFRGNKEITSFNEFRYFTGVTFLSTTPSINTGAFEGCSALESICLPSSVTTIGDYSFSQCSALKVVGGMDNVATIMRYVFKESGMEELNLPSCAIMRTTIAPYSQIKRIIAPSLQKILGSLIKIYNLELLDVGAELNEIEYYSFWQMTTNKTTFICRATTPPSMGSYNNMTFCSAIYVPDASLEAYRTALNWNTYADRIHPLSEIEGVVIEDGYELQQDGTIKQNDNYFVVGFVSVNGGESITWGMPSGSGTVGYLVEYNAEGGRLDYWRGNAYSRTITTKSSTKKIKACFLLSQKDKSYILDNTNGKYLWKGANVE